MIHPHRYQSAFAVKEQMVRYKVISLASLIKPILIGTGQHALSAWGFQHCRWKTGFHKAIIKTWLIRSHLILLLKQTAEKCSSPDRSHGGATEIFGKVVPTLNLQLFEFRNGEKAAHRTSHRVHLFFAPDRLRWRVLLFSSCTHSLV